MAGLSQEDLDAFAAKIKGNSTDDFVRGPNPKDVPVPGGDPPSKFTEAVNRIGPSLQRLANNPGFQTAAGAMNPGGSLVTPAMQYGINKAGLGNRDTTSFVRDSAAQPSQVSLSPMSQPDVAVPSSPQLNPALGQLGRPGGGGGGSGGGGMGDLAARYHQAQQNQFGTLDEQRDLVERRGELQSERVDKEAEMRELEAAQKHRYAEIRAEHDAKVAEKHEAFLQRNQELSDQIGADKINPDKIMGDKSIAQKIGFVIAGALNGAAGNGQGYMNQIQSMIDQGVKAQMANSDNKKHQLSARQNLFSQMMAESGDQRVAEAQTKNLMWESVKQDMDAKAARLGIPEIANNAALLRNQIEETKQNPLRVQLTGDALRAQQAAAAAAAAAQHAAEKQAWERSLEVAKLGQEQDKINIDRAKLEKGKDDDINGETAKLGAALADPKLASGRAAVENSKRRLGIAEDGTVIIDPKTGKPQVDQTAGLPGVGGLADMREKLAPKPTGAAALNPAAWVNYGVAGLSGDERVSRGDFDKVRLAYQVQITGAGGSEEQMRQITSAFAGANTPAEQRNAIAEADAMFKQIEARHKAGVSPEARKTYESRLRGLDPTLPSSVKITPR